MGGAGDEVLCASRMSRHAASQVAKEVEAIVDYVLRLSMEQARLETSDGRAASRALARAARGLRRGAHLA